MYHNPLNMHSCRYSTQLHVSALALANVRWASQTNRHGQQTRTDRQRLTSLLPRLLNELDLGIVWLLQGRVTVEQVGHEGQVKLVVALHHLTRPDKSSTVYLIRLLQHQLGSLRQVSRLRGEKHVK